LLCFLDVLRANNTHKRKTLLECQNQSKQTSQFDIVYQGIPGAADCQPELTKPCDSSWQLQEYQSQAWHSKAKMEVCTPCQAPTTTPTTTQEACTKHDYTEAGCRVKAQELGLQLGGAGYAFAGTYAETGCYAYNGGKYSGMAYYGYLASGGEVQSASQLTAVSGANKYRVQPCQATTVTTTTSSNPAIEYRRADQRSGFQLCGGTPPKHSCSSASDCLLQARAACERSRCAAFWVPRSDSWVSNSPNHRGYFLGTCLDSKADTNFDFYTPEATATSSTTLMRPQ